MRRVIGQTVSKATLRSVRMRIVGKMELVIFMCAVFVLGSKKQHETVF